MNIAIVGTGYVADFYLNSLQYNSSLSLVGVFDIQDARSSLIAKKHHVKQYVSLEDLLNDDHVSIVINLTNPDSHYAVSMACLKANKHVYSEKPLAASMNEGKYLCDYAEKHNLYLSCAPCNLLGETAQTVWKLLDDGAIGTPEITYVELDDGPIHKSNPENWRSESGFKWPYENELKVGCTIEHAAYATSLLTAYFGAAKTVVSYSKQIMPNRTQNSSSHSTPDISLSTIEFESGVVARITCGLFAQRNRSIMIAGTKSYIALDEIWNYREPINVMQYNDSNGYMRSDTRGWFRRLIKPNPNYQFDPIVSPKQNNAPNTPLKIMDYCRGVSELASAIEENRRCRLSARHALHLLELSLALQEGGREGRITQMTTEFDPIEPMPWSRI